LGRTEQEAQGKNKNNYKFSVTRIGKLTKGMFIDENKNGSNSPKTKIQKRDKKIALFTVTWQHANLLNELFNETRMFTS